ncbi:MAG: hypothetical protein U0930_03150 [Pirellulales bacterium]
MLLRRGGIHIDEENNPKGPKSICEKANDLLESIKDWGTIGSTQCNYRDELHAAVEMVRQSCEKVLLLLEPCFSTVSPYVAVLVEKNEAENELKKLQLAIHDVLSRLGYRVQG